MSPVSRKRTKKAGSAKRPPGGPQRARFDPLYGLLAEALRPTLSKVDPLEAELVVSEFLGSMRGADPARPAVATDNLDGLIKDLTSRTTREATAALVALAQLAPAEPSRALARKGLRAGSRVLPAWAEAIGAWRLARVMVLTDAFGDQAHVLLEFDGAGARHTLGALVDFSHLGGWCPDLLVTPDPDALHGAMAQDAAASEGLARFAPLDPAAACFLLVRALAATDMTHQPDVAASFGDTIALALARLRLVSAGVGSRADDAAAVREALGSAGVAVPFDLDHPPAVDPAERGRIVERFGASAPVAAHVGVPGTEVEYLARLLVDYGFDYDNGRPLRVSPTKLGNFLLRWLPRKATLDADDRAAVPAVIAAWVEFAVGLSLLPPAAVEKLHAELAGLLTDFATEYDNPANFGPARALLEGVGEVSSLEELKGIVAGRVAEHNAGIAAESRD
ncbi:hypothetical protein [Pengzhenrongella sp.]|jgi:hypothetical protein|uniref:hypothetical protein n=1 Tax=Pengzhenrongella sp. TaxID=2888820 RepID=UPI002F92C44E